MGQNVLWANHASSNATWGNPKGDECKISTFVYDISAQFHKTDKFQGRNSLRKEDCNIPTLTHICLNHLHFVGFLFNEIMFINSNTPNLFIWQITILGPTLHSSFNYRKTSSESIVGLDNYD